MKYKQIHIINCKTSLIQCIIDAGRHLSRGKLINLLAIHLYIGIHGLLFCDKCIV